jgi:hypothetical protein
MSHQEHPTLPKMPNRMIVELINYHNIPKCHIKKVPDDNSLPGLLDLGKNVTENTDDRLTPLGYTRPCDDHNHVHIHADSEVTVEEEKHDNQPTQK